MAGAKTPPPCDPEIYKKGEVVFVTHTIPARSIERWVKKIAKRSGQRVDWHFVGGRAVVKALGDIARVQAELVGLLPEHDALMIEAHRDCGLEYMTNSFGETVRVGGMTEKAPR